MWKREEKREGHQVGRGSAGRVQLKTKWLRSASRMLPIWVWSQDLEMRPDDLPFGHRRECISRAPAIECGSEKLSWREIKCRSNGERFGLQSMNNPAQAAHAEVRPQEAMLKLISGFWISRAIYITAKLGVADLIKDQPRTVDELATATGTHAPSLYRVLRALASVGVFAEDGDMRLSLTPLAETLKSGVPGSLRAFAMTELGEEHYPARGDLMHSVRTGEIAFDHHFGMDVWKFFEQHPENAKIFNDAMSGMTAAANEAILARYDFSPVKKLVDVGGGHGGLITSILKANRSVKGVLFDSPQAIEGAQTRIEAAGLVDRCAIIAG